MRENDYEDYNSLSIAFLKAIKNNEVSIFGTKDKNRYIFLNDQVKKTKAINNDYLYRILIYKKNLKLNTILKIMLILGINDTHDASACLIKDGKLVAVLQEERIARIKNIGGFPGNAIKDCFIQII